MHTLPVAVEPHLCTINPMISVVAFYSRMGNISLYRFNGEVVWTVPARKQTAATKLIWSPSGENLAIIYADGLFQVLHQSTGKTAQIVANQNASTLVWQAQRVENKPVEPFRDLKSDLNLSTESILAVGSRDSSLKINLDGFLPIGAITLDTTPIIDIICNNQKDYVCATEHSIYLIKANYLDTWTDRQINGAVVKPAKIQKILDQLVTADSKLKNEQRQFEAALDKFFCLENPVFALYNAIVTGFPTDTCIQWIEDMHESSFKAWVKAYSQYYASFEQLVIKQLIPLADHIVIHLGDSQFGGDECQALIFNVVHKLYKLVEKVQAQKSQANSFAIALQSIYCQHTERAMKVVDQNDDSCWLEAATYVEKTLANPKLLAGPSSEIAEFATQLEAAMASVKSELHKHFHPTAIRTWQDKKVLHVQKRDELFYVLAAGDQSGEQSSEMSVEVFILQQSGTYSHASFGDAQQAFFIETGIVVLKQHELLVYGWDTKPVFHHKTEYSSRGCSVIGGHICIVSNDGLHFEVINYLE